LSELIIELYLCIEFCNSSSNWNFEGVLSMIFLDFALLEDCCENLIYCGFRLLTHEPQLPLRFEKNNFNSSCTILSKSNFFFYWLTVFYISNSLKKKFQEFSVMHSKVVEVYLKSCTPQCIKINSPLFHPKHNQDNPKRNNCPVISKFILNITS
jgi:hypothetical protein